MSTYLLDRIEHVTHVTVYPALRWQRLTVIPAAVLSDNNWAAVGRGPHLPKSSLPGVFAVGDVRAYAVKRAAAAVGEGSMAVRLVKQFLGQSGSPDRRNA